VADLLTTAGTDRVLTMDLHAGQIMGFFNIPVDNLNALPVLLPYLSKKYGDRDLTIVSPDAGGTARARELATRLGNVNIAVIDKRRAGPNQVSEMNVVGNVQGKTCIIVDDMCDTGGTLVKAAETLKEDGAEDIIAVCIHPIFSGNATERLCQSPFSEIVVTDTIPQAKNVPCDKVTVLSVAPLFAEALRRIHSEDSVSSLFR
jgi:ribose-phosphate pyrophosphokinase